MKRMASTDTEAALVDGKVGHVCMHTHTLGEAEELRQHFCQSHHLTYLNALGLCVKLMGA